MCSTRRMSLSVGSVNCSAGWMLTSLPPCWIEPGLVSSAASCLGSQPARAAQFRQVGVDDHEDEDRGAQDDQVLVRADAAQVEPVLQFAEDQHAEPHPDHRADPAQHGRTADDRAGYAHEHHRELAGAGVDDVVLEGFQDPGERPERAAHHEVADFDPVDLDARFPRAEQVAAHRDRVQAPPGPGQQDVEEQDEDAGPDDLRPRLAAEPAADAHRLSRQVDLLRRGDRQRVAVHQVAGAERGDQRRDAEHGGDHAVDQPDHGAHHHRNHDGQDGREAGVDEEVHDERREGPDEPDRQVDLATDHHQDQADADDHIRAHVLGNVDEAAVAEEVRGAGRPEVDEQDHGDRRDAGLTLIQEDRADTGKDARAATSPRGGAGYLGAAFGRVTHIAHPNRATSPDACLESYPGTAAIHAASLPVNRRGPALHSVARSGDQVGIAPVCLMYTCLVVEPSNRVCVAVYAAALPLTTNFRPVSVVAGATSPPDSWYR